MSSQHPVTTNLFSYSQEINKVIQLLKFNQSGTELTLTFSNDEIQKLGIEQRLYLLKNVVTAIEKSDVTTLNITLTTSVFSRASIDLFFSQLGKTAQNIKKLNIIFELDQAAQQRGLQFHDTYAQALIEFIKTNSSVTTLTLDGSFNSGQENLIQQAILANNTLTDFSLGLMTPLLEAVKEKLQQNQVKNSDFILQQFGKVIQKAKSIKESLAQLLPYDLYTLPLNSLSAKMRLSQKELESYLTLYNLLEDNCKKQYAKMMQQMIANKYFLDVLWSSSTIYSQALQSNVGFESVNQLLESAKTIWNAAQQWHNKSIDSGKFYQTVIHHTQLISKIQNIPKDFKQICRIFNNAVCYLCNQQNPKPIITQSLNHEKLRDIVADIGLNITCKRNGRKTKRNMKHKTKQLSSLMQQLDNQSINVNDALKQARKIVQQKRNAWHFWQQPHSVKELEQALQNYDLPKY